jgi:hypothetical protein
MFFLFLIISSSFYYAKENNIIATLFNAEWELDRTNSESVDGLLRLIGIDSIRRNIINNLAVTETYLLTKDTFRLKKVTYYRTIDDTFKLNVEETVQDYLLGEIKQKVSFINNKIQIQMTRSNNDVLISTRKFASHNSNKIVYTLNYTTHDNKKSSYIRYFVRK